MTTSRFPTVDPQEKVVLSLDFVKRLVLGETITTATLDVKTDNGMDSDAATRFGTPQIDGSKVLVAFSGGIDGADYHIKFIVETDNPDSIPVYARILPCRKA